MINRLCCLVKTHMYCNGCGLRICEECCGLSEYHGGPSLRGHLITELGGKCEFKWVH